MAGQRFQGLALARGRRGRGQVERLHREARDLARPRRPVVGGRGEDQLFLGPRHGHVEEAPLLVQVRVAARHRLRQEVGGQLQRVAPRAQRELLLDAAHEEDDRELEPLGLVHGEDGHGVVVGIRLRDRGVVARLAQEVEVGHEGGDAVVLGHVAVALHDLEEARDVLDPRLRLRARLLREAGQEARGLEEAVEDFARAPAGHVFGRLVEIGDEARGGLARGAADPGQLLVRGQAAQHLEQRPVLPRGVPVQADEVALRHRVELAAREMEDGHRVVRARPARAGTRRAAGPPRARRGRGCP